MPEFTFRIRISADVEKDLFTYDDAESVIQAIIDNADYARPGMAIPPRAVEVDVGDGVFVDVYTDIEVE